MPDRLFDRRVRLLVASPLREVQAGISHQFVEVEDLRVTFKVEKDLEKQPNRGEVTVYNLAEETRAGMTAKGAKVVVQAGYRDAVSQLFVGDARVIDHRLDGADWVTKIEAGDGERGYVFGHVSESFAGGVRLPKVVEVVAGKLGIDVSDVSKADFGGRSFPNGYAAHGRASRELDKLLGGAGFEWSVQDEKLLVHPPDKPGTRTVTVISEDSGLVGSPEYGTPDAQGKPPVLKVKSLLIPSLLPGGQVKLVSRKHNGLHRVKAVVHTGDTHGGDWYTDAELEVLPGDQQVR